jgi:hypothetical protein
MHSSSRAIVTIATNNYLHWTRALFASVRRVYGGDRRLIAYVIGALPPGVSGSALGFELIAVESLGLAAFSDMAFRCTAFELANALKPRVIAHALSVLGLDDVIYLDSDIVVTSRLDEAEHILADGACMAATPHISQPHRQSSANRELLRAGRLNTGFIAARKTPEVLSFLKWLADTLEIEAKVDLSDGYFVDQSWFQHAPGFVDGFAEIRHDGYNVGHWNFEQRPIRVDGDAYRANGEPLRFFHRSGADLDMPGQISRFAPHLHRRDHPGVDCLLGEHDAMLAQGRYAGGIDLRALKYHYGRFHDGSDIPLAARRAYALRYPHGQSQWKDELFAAGTHPCNRRAKDVPALPGIVITELMNEIWENDPKLKGDFDLRFETGQEALCAWLAASDEAGRLRVAAYANNLKIRAEGLKIDGLQQRLHEMNVELARVNAAHDVELGTLRDEMERRSHALRWLVPSTLRELLRRVRATRTAPDG